MAKDNLPMTRAIRALKDNQVTFLLKPYKYQEKGGTEVAARELGVGEHQVIKTLVMEDEKGNPLLILMHGDREVSTKNLARSLQVKEVSPCHPDTAKRHTGYEVGGISPFGTKKALRVCVEASILELPSIFINAGRKGLLAEMSPHEMERVLKPRSVNVAI